MWLASQLHRLQSRWRVGRTIACSTASVLRNLRASSPRKVRAPQRRVAGNARPSRGEDKCHRDAAAPGATRERKVKRGKLYPEQGQIGGRGSSIRATGRSGGRGSAAQSSGRPLEPPGNRWPEMDDRRRGIGRGTELGLQAGSPPAQPYRRLTSFASPGHRRDHVRANASRARLGPKVASGGQRPPRRSVGSALVGAEAQSSSGRKM